MRCSIMVLSTLIFASANSKAQSNRPLPPAPWTPFTSASDSSLTGITSIAAPPISLEGANLSFEVRIQNPNNKPIRCLATKFSADMGLFGESCRTAPYSIYIDVNDGLGSIEVPANSTSAVKHVGNKEREDSGRALGSIDLEFCNRDAWDLDCGYDCGSEIKYSHEAWEEVTTGGKRKFVCEASGVTKRTADPINCDSGYSADPTNDRCLKMCDNIHRAGDAWPKAIENGSIVYSCLASGDVVPQVSCLQNPLHVVTGETCQAASCGGTKHGDRGNRREIINGFVTSRCEYGNWSDEFYECNPDAIKEGPACRPGNRCNMYGLGHLEIRMVNFSCGVCASGPGGTTTYKCSDGKFDAISKTGYCEVIEGCHGRTGTAP